MTPYDNLWCSYGYQSSRKGRIVSISSRLREERQRLNLSQTAFAAIAGVTKSAQIKWESGSSSLPTASALAAWAGAGVDVLYVVTGKRLPQMPTPDDELFRDDLDEIRRDLIAPVRQPGETEEQAEVRTISRARVSLERMVSYDVASDTPPDLVHQAIALLEATNDPHKLSLLRAADHAQARSRRDHEKEMLSIWLNGWPYQPDHAVMELMARITLEYGVPHRIIVDLAHEIFTDVTEQSAADRIIRQAEKDGDV